MKRCNRGAFTWNTSTESDEWDGYEPTWMDDEGLHSRGWNYIKPVPSSGYTHFVNGVAHVVNPPALVLFNTVGARLCYR